MYFGILYFLCVINAVIYTILNININFFIFFFFFIFMFLFQ